MTAYTIRTDAVMQTIEAESMDAAAVEFARDEGLSGVTDVDSLLAAVQGINGAWCWIEVKGDSGTRRGANTPEAMRA